MLRLKLQQSEKEIHLDRVSFEKEEGFNHFILQSSENPDVSLVVPYKFDVEDSYDHSKYASYPFTSPILNKENDIFEVVVDVKKVGRIGWIFPIQALSSTEHSKAKNTHFLRYAFAAFFKLLRGEFFDKSHLFEFELTGQLEISQIYRAETVVLCLSNSKTDQLPGFDMSNFLHSLYSYRYFAIDAGINEYYHDSMFQDLSEDIREVRLSEISISLKEEIFIKSLFRHHLRFSNHPLVQFHLLYQIVELLINRIYECEIEKILAIAKGNNKSHHDLLDEIEALQTEKFRIQKLSNGEYLRKQPSSASQLVRSSNLLLAKFNKEKLQVTDAFYAVRNLIVHDFREIARLDPDLALLRQINIEFERYLIEILGAYVEEERIYDLEKKPTAWLMYRLLMEAGPESPRNAGSFS